MKHHHKVLCTVGLRNLNVDVILLVMNFARVILLLLLRSQTIHLHQHNASSTTKDFLAALDHSPCSPDLTPTIKDKMRELSFHNADAAVEAFEVRTAGLRKLSV